MIKKLLIVNEKDKIVGTATKEKCHQGRGILHRAFAIFIFNNKNQLLIQQRSKFKKLWPGYWENSCCSHPFKNEIYLKAGKRRLKEELGFSCPLHLVDKFQFQASYKNLGSENEVCAILVGKYNGKIRLNPREVTDWKWIDVKILKKDISKNPDKYTPWLKLGLDKAIKAVSNFKK